MAKDSADPKSSMPAYDGPPDYRLVGQHYVFPQVTHDEAERFNFLGPYEPASAARVLPGVKTAFEQRIAPKAGDSFKSRHDVRKALLKDPAFQTWSALRRATMEQRQQAGRWVTLRQGEALTARARELTQGDDRLPAGAQLHRAELSHRRGPSLHARQLSWRDRRGRCDRPGQYDCGIFATTGGALGRYNDGGGHAVVAWLKKHLPDFKPKRILDLGCGSRPQRAADRRSLPRRRSDRGGLRRAHAALWPGPRQIARHQQCEIHSGQCRRSLSRFADESFDWVQTHHVPA